LPERLLTSEDLFGDMVDEPIRAEGHPPSTPARTAPIRVQVNEAGETAPPKPKPAQVLPEDMPALLDAFEDSSLEPARTEITAEPRAAQAETAKHLEPIVAARPWAASQPSPLAGDEEDFSGLLDSMAPTDAPRPELPEPVLDTSAETLVPGMLKAFSEASAVALSKVADEDVVLDDLLEEPAGAKTLAPGSRKVPAFDEEPAPVPVAAAPPRPERPLIPPTDLDQLLEGVFAPATAKAPAGTPKLAEDVPGLGELLKSVPQPASRTATKFQAAAPKIAAAGESRMMLDLASLAEDALGLPPEQQEPTAPAHGAGVGDDFGPYRLLEKVATGGMAEVFRAKRTGVEGFEKVVALKRILPHLSDNKEFVDMFVDEAKMVAGLTHPNIVQIFDLGRIDSTYFIAMEYIAGRDLRSILRRAKDKGLGVPLDLCVLITGRVAAALEYAHRKKDEAGRALKIVHRDVSPQNILISFEGEVKLTDFGIAKATSKATSTDRGALRGKLLYMSPEQALGKPMDRRADVFSLGVCFYEMITDRKPFMGTSEMGILEMVRECRVSPPSLVNPRVPERIEKVVMKALDREPEHRYQDAGEMLRDLERTLTLRQAPTALELSRFMEELFESAERGVALAPEEASAEPAPVPEREHLEIDLEPEEAPAAPAAQEPDAKPASGQAGLGRFLKKFGIK
jgi:serine/threonine protein kinase